MNNKHTVPLLYVYNIAKNHRNFSYIISEDLDIILVSIPMFYVLILEVFIITFLIEFIDFYSVEGER